MSARSVGERTRNSGTYDVLRNVRRRYVIYHLRARGGEVSVEELVDQITNWEDVPSEGGAPSERRRSVRNALVQTHLPKLDRHGFVVFDERERVVRPTERVSTVEIYPASQSVEWTRYFVLLSGVTLVLAWIDLSAISPNPLESLPWEAFVLVGFVLLTLTYGYDRRRWRSRFRREGPDLVIEESGDD